MSWARRLKRVFGIEIEACARCGGKLKIIASIEDAVRRGEWARGFVSTHRSGLRGWPERAGSGENSRSRSCGLRQRRWFESTIRTTERKVALCRKVRSPDAVQSVAFSEFRDTTDGVGIRAGFENHVDQHALSVAPCVPT